MKTTVKNAGAVLGAAMMATAGIAGAVPAFADEAPAAAEAQAVEAGAAEQKAVEGEFAFTQDAVTSMGVFAKAAAAACASLPDYAATCTCLQIAVASGDVQLIATVQEMMVDDDVETHIMGCACSSNVADGGAVGNAEVSGVSLASLAAMMGA